MVGFFPNFLISVNIIFVMVVNILTSVNIIFISVSIISVIWRTGQGFFIMQNGIDQKNFHDIMYYNVTFFGQHYFHNAD